MQNLSIPVFYRSFRFNSGFPVIVFLLIIILHFVGRIQILAHNFIFLPTKAISSIAFVVHHLTESLYGFGAGLMTYHAAGCSSLRTAFKISFRWADRRKLFLVWWCNVVTLGEG